MTKMDYVAVDVAQSIAGRIWTQHDPTAIREIFTSDVVYADVPWDYTFNGHQAVLDYFNRVLLGIPDFVEEISEVIDVRPVSSSPTGITRARSVMPISRRHSDCPVLR
jgi:hypothetical protein